MKRPLLRVTRLIYETNALDALLTPPPTRQTTPVIPSVPQFELTPIKTVPFTKVVEAKRGLPTWAVISLQIVITVPLYIFSFWLMVEALKAGGEDLVDLIDYLAFRPSMKRDL